MAVHRCTERKPARGYGEVWEFSDQRKQKAGKTLFGSIRVKAVFVLFACSRKPAELPSVTRIASASHTFGCAQQWRVDWMNVEPAVSAALGRLPGGTPATTALLWHEGGDVHTK